MPHSLRAKLSGLRYKGIIEDKDYKRLCHALDLEKAEQQPCDDAISRQVVMDALCDECELFHKNGEQTCLTKCESYHFLSTLPSVTLKSIECDDAISREELLEAIDTWDRFGVDDTNSLFRLDNLSLPNYVPYIHYDDVVNSIKGMPPVTPPQKYGKWIKHPEIETSIPEYLMFYECSECGDKQCFCKSDLHKKRFCNSCGAKMQESEEV